MNIFLQKIVLQKIINICLCTISSCRVVALTVKEIAIYQGTEAKNSLSLCNILVRPLLQHLFTLQRMCEEKTQKRAI